MTKEEIMRDVPEEKPEPSFREVFIRMLAEKLWQTCPTLDAGEHGDVATGVADALAEMLAP